MLLNCLQLSRSYFSLQTGHFISFMSYFSSWTLSVVFKAYDFIFFFKWLLSSFSTYTFSASREKRGSLANNVLSLIKSTKPASSGSSTLYRRIDKTYFIYFWHFLEVLTLVCREYLVNLGSSIVVVT